jgi:hypothetical protein
MAETLAALSKARFAEVQNCTTQGPHPELPRTRNEVEFEEPGRANLQISNMFACFGDENSPLPVNCADQCRDPLDAVDPNFLEFIEQHMSSFQCPAHDYEHVLRVAYLAHSLASNVKEADPYVAFIAGLVHDVLDSKLCKLEGKEKGKEMLTSKLTELGLDDANIAICIDVATNVGYKNMIRPDWDVSKFSAEFRCVQDADLLDAIGALLFYSFQLPF